MLINMLNFTLHVVLSSEALGVSTPIRTQVPIHYFDFELRPKARLAQPIPKGWSVFAYVLEGALKFGKMLILWYKHADSSLFAYVQVAMVVT
jgi:redox-sensitive bicupin YhaK (pirin superfamily)